MSKLVKWCALVLSILTFTLVIAERLGALDWYLHLKPMQKVAENLSSSYAPVQRIYTPADSEWRPTIRLIRRYTSAPLPEKEQPKAIARTPAVLSGEKTSPTEPSLSGQHLR